MPLLQETISHHHGGCGHHGGFSLGEFRENHGGGVHHKPPGQKGHGWRISLTRGQGEAGEGESIREGV